MQFDVPGRVSGATPDSASVKRIRAKLMGAATPIRPLPSSGAMMALSVGVFVVMAILLTIPFGFQGFSRLTPGAAAIEYSAVLLLALALSGVVVGQMIPGSRRILGPVAGVVLSVVLLSAMASLLFPVFEMRNFVRQGIHCLRLGTLCAIPAAGLIGLAMKRGFVTDTLQAAIAGGALAGLLGIGVLALHCPIVNASHIVAWHVAVIAVTSLLGAISGWCLSRFV